MNVNNMSHLDTEQSSSLGSEFRVSNISLTRSLSVESVSVSRSIVCLCSAALDIFIYWWCDDWCLINFQWVSNDRLRLFFSRHDAEIHHFTRLSKIISFFLLLQSSCYTVVGKWSFFLCSVDEWVDSIRSCTVNINKCQPNSMWERENMSKKIAIE